MTKVRSNSTRRTLVVKVGTSTLTDSSGKLDRSFLLDLTTQLAQAQVSGWDVLLVSSGAIRAGREALDSVYAASLAVALPGADRREFESISSLETDSLPYKQAAAALG